MLETVRVTNLCMLLSGSLLAPCATLCPLNAIPSADRWPDLHFFKLQASRSGIAGPWWELGDSPGNAINLLYTQVHVSKFTNPADKIREFKED